MGRLEGEAREESKGESKGIERMVISAEAWGVRKVFKCGGGVACPMQLICNGSMIGSFGP